MKFTVVEDAKQDWAFRQEANGVWNQIISLPKNSPSWEHNEDGSVLNMGELNPRYANLFLQLVPADEFDRQPEGTGSFGKDRDDYRNSIINLYVPGARPPWFYLGKKYESFRRILKISFVHEFVHYLDRLRFKDPKNYGKEPFNYGMALADLVKYFNKPHEFNAYTQQFMHMFEDAVEETIKDLKKQGQPEALENFLKNKLEGDFSTFKKFFKLFRFLSGNIFYEFYQRLDQKHKNKFHRRLYGFYVQMKKQLEEKLKEAK